MNTFYDHPRFIDVRLEVIGPIKPDEENFKINAQWWLKRWALPWCSEEMTIEKSRWRKFVRESKVSVR